MLGRERLGQGCGKVRAKSKVGAGKVWARSGQKARFRQGWGKVLRGIDQREVSRKRCDCSLLVQTLPQPCFLPKPCPNLAQAKNQIAISCLSLF